MTWFSGWLGSWFGGWFGPQGAQPTPPDAPGASAGVTIIPRDTLVTVTARACERPTVKPRVDVVHVISRCK